MSIDEYVQQSREEIRQMFGDVELKEDCKNYIPGKGCLTCSPKNTGRHIYMQCEYGVCYFYKSKMSGKDNENG